MEKQQERRNVGEKEDGQPSRNSGQTGPEAEEHRIDIEISPRVKNWIGSLKNAEERTQSQTQWPRTPKVPQMLRGTQDFNKFYEPRVISIGPYHHGKPDLQPGERIKPLCALDFLADSNQDIEALYATIKRNIEAVKECYDWSGTNENHDDEALAWMMLLDGCFLLCFIHCLATKNTSRLHDLTVKDHMITFVHQDLFLLENQLPFRVLKLIFEQAEFNNGSRMEDLIEKFVRDTARPEGPKSEIQLEKHSHLLDLLRSTLLGQGEPEQEQRPKKKGRSSSSQGGDGGFCCPWQKDKEQDNWPSFRHIKELKAAGIHLKPSRTSCLRDISFESGFFRSNLKLPPVIIDDFTKPKFLNLVAYEMCPDAPKDYMVTSYICFLDILIDHADDVKELRSKHILYNCLGSDEDVAQLFNEITKDLGDPDAYGHVKASIQKHYENRWNAWIAEALHDYFRSPWTFMAFIAAALVLFLTGLQTYYSHPGKHLIHIYIWLIVSVVCSFLVWCLYG